MNKLYVISTGAGGLAYLSSEALLALNECEVVVSYRKYAKELSSLIEGKELYMSGMTKEIDRCNQAIEFAKSGKTTCIISNGDANVYGMSSLIVELLDENSLWDEVDLEVIPGITAFLAAAAKVGAPISGDFSIISLSDKLTDINLIKKRVDLALEGDFVLGIYNPKSRKRIQPYLNFLESLKKYDKRVCVIASNIGRESKEKIVITDTKKLISQNLENPDISMSTLLIIGNSTTKLTKNGMVLTPRGYMNKYNLKGELKIDLS